MPLFEVQGPDGKTYEVDAPDAATAAGAFGPKKTEPSTASGMQQQPSLLQTIRNGGPPQQSMEQMQAQGQQGAKSMLAGIKEGGNLLWEGAKQSGAAIQDAYQMFVHGKANRKEEAVRDATGKLVSRDTEFLPTSKEAQSVATSMLAQAVRQQEDIDKGVNIPDRNFSAGATQIGALALAPEAGLPRATTAVGGMVKNSAAGAAGSGLMFNSDPDNQDALISAGIAPVFGLIPSLVPAVKNFVGRGLAKAAEEGRSAARVAGSRAVLGKDFGYSLAQETGIPELVTLERSAYNSKMVNYFADQTDKFVKRTVSALRQPMKEGQTLANDFVSARTMADKNLKDFKASASDNYEQGILDARRIASQGKNMAVAPVPAFKDQVAKTFEEVRGLSARGVERGIFTKRFMDHTEGLFTREGREVKDITVPQMADLLVDLTALQRSENAATRLHATKLRNALEPDLDNMENAATFSADDAVKTILETRKEYRRAQQLIGELGDSAAYKLLGVGDEAADPGAALSKLKSFDEAKQVDIRKFLEDNSPDLLTSMKDAAVKEAQKHASTIRAAADSQNDLGQMMDTMFDAKKGFDLRTQGVWSADELKKMEGIKDGLRTIANNRPTMGGAGTPIKSEDIAINLVSKSEAFIARQATRIFMGAKAADLFTDPEVYKLLTKINRSTTGSPVNLAARAALLDRMQTDYAEQQEEEQK